MKKRVSNKVLDRIGRIALAMHPDPHGGGWAYEAARAYRTGTWRKALRRRYKRSGGTVCLDCASIMRMDRC